MPRKKKTSKKKTSKSGSKADFIRSMPANMPVKKVVEEAKKVGLAITDNHVYGVRSAAKKAGKKTAKAAVKKTTKKATPKAKPKVKARPKPEVSKKAFVLSFSADTSAAEILDKAKAARIALTRKYIYNVRGQAKVAKKIPKKTAKKTKAAPTPKPVVRTTPRTGSAEERFVDLVLDIGLVRAGELLAKIKERVKGLRLV